MPRTSQASGPRSVPTPVHLQLTTSAQVCDAQIRVEQVGIRAEGLRDQKLLLIAEHSRDELGCLLRCVEGAREPSVVYALWAPALDCIDIGYIGVRMRRRQRVQLRNHRFVDFAPIIIYVAPEAVLKERLSLRHFKRIVPPAPDSTRRASAPEVPFAPR